jgi:predicted Zn-dependent peptidase
MVEDSPQELIMDLHMEDCWKEHPLGRPISGTKQSVARIARKDVRKFFTDNYTARNMIVAVAGNIRHQRVYELAERCFSDIEPGVPVNPGLPPDIHTGSNIRHKAHLEQTHLCLGTISPPMASEDRYKAHLLNCILGGGMSSRLFQNIREKRGLVYSIYSMLNLYHDAGALVVCAGAAPERAEEVVALTLKEFKKLRERLVSSQELKRAKEYIKGSIMLGLESSSSRMTNLAQQLIYHGRLSKLEDILSAVESVSAREIRRLADRLFDPSHFTLTALGNHNTASLKSVAMDV